MTVSDDGVQVRIPVSSSSTSIDQLSKYDKRIRTILLKLFYECNKWK
jgi:hypothetical protein